MKKIRWGILSTAQFGLNTSVPAMQQGEYSVVSALASRDLASAQSAAKRLAIPKAYGSYEELLADAEIDAIYNPLPNHLHVPWSIKALEAGKHVLCEKPIAMSAAEAQKLLNISKRYPHLKVMEAFMYRHHPQWQTALQLVREGQIGDLVNVHSFFSYHNTDPDNIRNRKDIGGGALMDIGCYCVSLSRFIFAAEPKRLGARIESDPTFGIDRLTSAVMEFDRGAATFTCATQLAGYQRATIYGTRGWIEIEIPFNAPNDRPCSILVNRDSVTEQITFDIVNQYTLQGDLFARAVLENTPVFTPLEDAVANMRIIDAIFMSAERGEWVSL
jgi:predicted dehydrogenase